MFNFERGSDLQEMRSTLPLKIHREFFSLAGDGAELLVRQLVQAGYHERREIIYPGQFAVVRLPTRWRIEWGGVDEAPGQTNFLKELCCG